MKREVRIMAVMAGPLVLAGCAAEEPTSDGGQATISPRTVVSTATESVTMTEADASAPSSSWEIGVPGSRFVGEIAAVPETDPAPFASSLIFPAQPGLQFHGPDGTYCEIYGDDDPTVLCAHDGEGDVNAVSLRRGEPATTHHVNRIFAPHERTRVLEPGTRLVDGPVSCAVPADDVRVMCAIDPYSFAVSRAGVALS